MPKQVCANRPACVALVDRGFCSECAAKGCGKDKRPTASQRGYGYRWQKTSRAFLAGKLCVGFPRGVHDVVRAAATQTDHIVPHRGDMKLFWNRDNWQPLCDSCHSSKTVKEDGGGFARRGSVAARDVYGTT